MMMVIIIIIIMEICKEPTSHAAQSAGQIYHNTHNVHNEMDYKKKNVISI